jgi:hypothetical protein
MDWQYRQAGPGSLVLTGEVDLAGTGDGAISTPLVDGGAASRGAAVRPSRRVLHPETGWLLPTEFVDRRRAILAGYRPESMGHLCGHEVRILVVRHHHRYLSFGSRRR